LKRRVAGVREGAQPSNKKTNTAANMRQERERILE
jgi:hypothetical protein